MLKVPSPKRTSYYNHSSSSWRFELSEDTGHPVKANLERLQRALQGREAPACSSITVVQLQGWNKERGLPAFLLTGRVTMHDAQAAWGFPSGTPYLPEDSFSEKD